MPLLFLLVYGMIPRIMIIFTFSGVAFLWSFQQEGVLLGFRRFCFVFIAFTLSFILIACGAEMNGSVSTTQPAETEVTSTSLPVETIPVTEATVPTVVPEPAQPSLLSFLQTAVEPVGTTMYVWGGGWNEEDTGAGVEAVSLGVSPQWAAFAMEQDAAYNYKNHRYQIHDGLDCSGYVGWAVYNALETEDGGQGYVCKAADMAQEFSLRGLGEYIPVDRLDHWRPGDIMSMKGHVWISLGMCDDGSVLLVHASPPGVILCGTELPDGGESQAVRLARSVMAANYPDWYRRYPDCSRSCSYLDKSSAMRWSREVLTDEEGLAEKTADQVAALLWAGG